eukprot:CAMPEP_0173212852 /NCGR_PEP_ID=MMETSP1141-20130122/25049_1 /TAXON_ID=483371 /ORGANISM="non described non described, Strain CCMP2298" /LENGTH=278 /DNA_ID=CAMNT_0014139955 /DNA_START=60 /DNA_END=897 /DNA_ORIENTATION=+
MSSPAEGKKISIKMLLSNNLTGSLIGAGGKSIKELQAVTGAKVHVSSNMEPFPGTSDRVVVLTGPYESVSLTQNLIWELIALVTSAANAKEVEWSPQAMLAKLGENDAIDVVGKLTVPAAAGGLILGRGGANIRSLSEESGARVNMTSKDEALFTQERVITLVGTTASCIKCTNMILRKLEEPDESPPTPAAETVITLSVPNELMGNIFGKQGATLREIISLSGARVSVSGRGEFMEGTNNRVVTITGTPGSAQTAHLFINQRLQTPANPRRVGPGGV